MSMASAVWVVLVALAVSSGRIDCAEEPQWGGATGGDRGVSGHFRKVLQAGADEDSVEAPVADPSAMDEAPTLAPITPAAPTEGCDGKCQDLYAALAKSVQSGDLDGVTDALDRGSPTELDDGTAPPLAIAAKENFVDIAILLIKSGADVNVEDPNGWTPLLIAAYNGHHEVVKVLLENGANPEEKRDDNGEGALHAAAAIDDYQTVELLLMSYGVSINEANKDGQTPLWLASFYGATSAIEVLLQQGADPEVVDNEGLSPRDAACVCAYVPDTDGRKCPPGKCTNANDANAILDILDKVVHASPPPSSGGRDDDDDDDDN